MNALSFAVVAQIPALPAKKSSLLLSSKSGNDTIQDKRKLLNRMDATKLPTVECLPLIKSNKLLITCSNTHDLTELKTTLETSTILNDVIEVT